MDIHHALIGLPEVGANSTACKAYNTHKCLWSLLALFLRYEGQTDEENTSAFRDLSLAEVTSRQTDNHSAGGLKHMGGTQNLILDGQGWLPRRSDTYKEDERMHCG